MKKVVASTALAALLFPVVSADTAVVTAHEEPAVVVEQTPECSSPDFGGVQFLLGIGGSFLKTKVKGADGNKFSKNVNRFIGTVGLGAGKVFKDKFYVGTEFLFDFTKNKDWNTTVDGTSARVKSNGCFLSLGLRLGYIVPTYNTMVYFKVAGSHSTAKVTEHTPELKASKIVPTLALGVEKAFCKKFTARLEGEYLFKSKKNKQGIELKSNDGFNVRALVSYNVRF